MYDWWKRKVKQFKNVSLNFLTKFGKIDIMNRIELLI